MNQIIKIILALMLITSTAGAYELYVTVEPINGGYLMIEKNKQPLQTYYQTSMNVLSLSFNEGDEFAIIPIPYNGYKFKQIWDQVNEPLTRVPLFFIRPEDAGRTEKFIITFEKINPEPTITPVVTPAITPAPTAKTTPKPTIPPTPVPTPIPTPVVTPTATPTTIPTPQTTIAATAVPTPEPTKTPQTISSSPQVGSFGTVTFKSDPEGAMIFIDGHKLGITPFIRDLSPGGYEIRYEKAGHANFTKKIILRNGDTQIVSVMLEKEKPEPIQENTIVMAATPTQTLQANLTANDNRQTDKPTDKTIPIIPIWAIVVVFSLVGIAGFVLFYNGMKLEGKKDNVDMSDGDVAEPGKQEQAEEIIKKNPEMTNEQVANAISSASGEPCSIKTAERARKALKIKDGK